MERLCKGGPQGLFHLMGANNTREVVILGQGGLERVRWLRSLRQWSTAL